MFGNQWHMARHTRRAEIARVSTVLAALAIGAAFWTTPVRAQTRGAPTIEIAAEIIVMPAVVTPLQIKISRSDAVPHQAMLMIRGLPPRVTLSEGRSFSPGVWAVPVGSVGKIEMTPAHDTSGQSALTMELLTLDGKVLANAASTLYILPAAVARDITTSTAGNENGNRVALTAGPLASRPDSPATATQTPANLTPTPSRLTPSEIENVLMLTSKGDENMLIGKIAAARLFYKSAAESGYAPAALALGATYDSRQLSQWKLASGQQADPVMARKWYEKARELGEPEASDRLQTLGAR